MKILSVLTYYRPHTSGLTIYAERLAKALVELGHEVTVLTSRYDPSLPEHETMDGVKIVRAPVLFRISKGVIMPTFGFLASKLVMEHDCIQLHLPQFDAAGISLRGRLLKKPTVITYHCDLIMPKGLLSRAANYAVTFMNRLAAIFTHRFVTYTRDYADHSSLLRRYPEKVEIIRPPIELPNASQEQIERFREQVSPERHQPVIGMASRFATEKGVEVLLDALPAVIEKYPNAQVWFAGPYQNIIGEEQYYRRLFPRIQGYIKGGHWKFLGNLDPEEISAFYPNIDLLVIPSLNSTEAFGLVQIEAMINGKPSIASNLPGVRQPPIMHEMGKVVPIGDAPALAEAILDVLCHPEDYHTDPEKIASEYVPTHIARQYLELFTRIREEIQKP